jgi:hypothetical protein
MRTSVDLPILITHPAQCRRMGRVTRLQRAVQAVVDFALHVPPSNAWGCRPPHPPFQITGIPIMRFQGERVVEHWANPGRSLAELSQWIPSVHREEGRVTSRP